MPIRTSLFPMLAALVFAFEPGCNQPGSQPPAALPEAPALSSDTILRVHWLGKKCLGTNAGAFYFMRLWELPETKRLQAQTLDKLSSAPWRLLEGQPAATNAPSAQLRPLLDDVAQEETCLEARETADHSSEIVFAIRLDSKRADIWETNLAVIIRSLTGAVPVAAADGGRGWDLKTDKPQRVIEVKRAGDWTLFGVARKKNLLLAEIVERINRERTPFPAPATNYWLKVDFDSDRAASSWGAGFARNQNVPQRVSITVSGDGANVLTAGEFTLSNALPSFLESWEIPTNVIQGPLASFTAARNVGSSLGSMKIQDDWQISWQPRQIFSWSLENNRLATYLAFPLSDTTDHSQAVIRMMLDKGNSWLAVHGVGQFVRLDQSNSVVLRGIPVLMPFLRITNIDSVPFWLAGTLPTAIRGTNSRSAEVLDDLAGRQNLMYYHWELTDRRIDSFLDLGQVSRVVLRRSQLQLDSAGAAWLNALRARVGPSITSVTGEGTNRLVLKQKSTVGLDGLELHMLVEWLESPEFPGFDTFSAPFRDGGGAK